MSPNKQTITACVARAAAATAFFAAALCCAAHSGFCADAVACAFCRTRSCAPRRCRCHAGRSPCGNARGRSRRGCVRMRPATSNVIKAAVLPPLRPPCAPIACNAPVGVHASRSSAAAHHAPARERCSRSPSSRSARRRPPAPARVQPTASYPSQLAADLRARFPDHDITVLNRGVNGEETDNMMARFAKDVIAAASATRDLAGRHQFGVARPFAGKACGAAA